MSFHISASDYLNYFSSGAQPSSIPVPITASTGGLGIVERQPAPVVPTYRRNLGTDYARSYRALEEQRLLNSEQQAEDEHLEDGTMTDGTTIAINRLEVDTYSAPLTLPDSPQQLVAAVVDDIYERYNFEMRDISSSVLPIQRFRETITRSIQACDVVVIEGHTGCGKTTQVPQYILDDCRRHGQPANIIVTQPRRIAAVSVARRVSRERNWPLGTLVGYEIGLDKCVGADTRLTFCTTGVLLQKLVHQRTLAPYTHVVLDEVHERSTDTDFALLLVRRLQRSRSRRTKVVLMSATVETRLFAEYFSRAVQGKLEPARVIDVGGRGFHQVNVHYIEELAPLMRQILRNPSLSKTTANADRVRGSVERKWDSFCIDSPSIDPLLYHLVSHLIKNMDAIEIAETEASDRFARFARVRGSVLVFLPGMSEIQELMSILSHDRVTEHWKLVPLHSLITSQEQSAVFERVSDDQRKIIISTNLAESSITVTDVKYVVDFCLTRQLELDPSSGYPSLRLVWASRASCRQRAGRTGRVDSGRVYRLVSKAFFHHQLSDYSVPEMIRSPLENVVVRAKKFCADLSPADTLALSLSPPDLQRIWLSVLRLKQMGALIDPVDTGSGEHNAGSCFRRHCEHDGELTLLGHVVAALPVDARLARLLVLGHAYGCLPECLTIAAGLTSKSIFARPFRDQLRSYRAKLAWSGETFSDCLAIVRAYSVWDSHTRDGHFQRSGGRGEREWAEAHSIQLRCMHELAQLRRELESRLDSCNIRPSCGPQIAVQESVTSDFQHQQQLVLQVCLAGAFYPNFLVHDPCPQSEMEAHRALNGHNPLTTVCVSSLPQRDQCAVLYYSQLIRQLRPILNFGQTFVPLPKIDFDCSRAFIDFEPCVGGSAGGLCSQMTGDIPTAVYLAVRLGQLSSCRLKIHRFSGDEEVQRIGEYRQLEDQLRSLSAGRNQAPHLMDTGTARACAMTAPPLCQLPGASMKSLPVTVTYIKDPSHFYIRYDTPHCTSDFEAVHTTITQWRGRCSSAKLLRVGQLYIAPFAESGSVGYYRARLEAVHYSQNSENAKVLVYFIDFGNTEMCDADKLLELCAELSCSCLVRVNAMAVRCQLSELKPPLLSNERWSEETTALFRRLALYKSGTARIYSVLHEVIHTELLIGEDCAGEFSVNRRLLDLSLADDAVESEISRQDHDKRVNSYRWSGGAAASCNVSEWQQAGSSNEPQLTEWLSALNSGDSFSGSSDVCVLRGPVSPLAMRLSAMARALHTRTVVVDSDSVNTVLLDSRPHTTYQRLMVAASLSPTSAGGSIGGARIRASGTTLMPFVPGLPFLMSLLFAPSVELRVDVRRGVITGALCGLGYTTSSESPDQVSPVFEDDDVEVVADVAISTSDLRDINLMRAIFWLMYLRPVPGDGIDSTVNGRLLESERTVLEHQQRLRKVLFRLLTARREPLSSGSGEVASASTAVSHHHSQRLPSTPSLATTTDRFSWAKTKCGDSLEPVIEEQMDDRLYSYLVSGSRAVWRSERRRLCAQVTSLFQHARDCDTAESHHCPLCEITLSSPRQLLHHINSNGHIGRLRELCEDDNEDS